MKSTEKKLIKCSSKETQFPIEVLNCWNLNELEIIGGNFTYCPEDFSILKNLQKLTITQTKIKQFPIEIFELPNLNYLNLKSNSIETLPCLSIKRKLKTLILGKNHLSKLTHFLHFFPKLTTLDLGQNEFKELPNEIIYLKDLQRLNLEGNLLNSLPKFLKELKKLNHLSIINNPFSKTEIENIEREFHVKISD